jgi:hypothetical protein
MACGAVFYVLLLLGVAKLDEPRVFGYREGRRFVYYSVRSMALDNKNVFEGMTTRIIRNIYT